MVRSITSLLFLVFAMSLVAFCDTTLDPIGFCAPPATVSACTTGVGFSNETIPVGTTQFGMEKNGSGTSTNPWYLLVAVPELTAGAASAPVITSASFTQNGATQNAGAFGQSQSGSIYGFASTSLSLTLVGDSSMNAPNMFCDGKTIPCTTSNEISAHGSLPNFFQIFVYTFNPGLVSNTPYLFSVGGSGLVGGTFLAGSGGSNPFSTPYTTAGLAQGPTATPEPASLALFGTGLFGLAGLLRRRK